MKYNEKYKRFIDNDYVIYRMNKEGKLVQVKPSFNTCGYAFFGYDTKNFVCVHRFIWETLKGPIPKGYEIDHINTIKTDNRIENLRLVTHAENMNNPFTLEKRRQPYNSEFGKKYFEHYGYSKYFNIKQYLIEHNWYRTHNHKCRWE